MSAPAFLVPLRLEARAVRRGAPTIERHLLGMGPVRAARSAGSLSSRLPADQPLALLGVAGGLTADLAPGDVVVASELHHLSGEPPLALAFAQQVAALLASAGLTVVTAPIVSSPKIVNSTSGRSQAAAHGAVAVDMESYWCGPLVAKRPFAVVRVLLDVPAVGLFSRGAPAALRKAARSLSTVASTMAAWSPTTLDTQALLEIGES